MTIYVRADFSTQPAASVTLIWYACMPPFAASKMTSLSVSEYSMDGPAAGAAAAAGAASAAAAGAGAGSASEMDLPLASALSFEAKLVISTTSSGPPAPTLSIICSKESMVLKSVSMISGLTFICSLRKRSKTFSMSCVSSAIFVNPIVADMPLIV